MHKSENKIEKTSYELTDDEANLIGVGLGKLPYEVAAPLIANLQKQSLEKKKKHTKPTT